jgi:DNA polymerase-3 subunit delta'
VLRHPDPAALRRDPPTGLDLGPDDPVSQLVAARSHPDVMVVERSLNPKTGRLQGITNVDEARAAAHFFSLTPAMGGWRLCIVDAADDLNREAANALLKVLEEPPARSAFLIVSHAPGQLLATIRSRCIRLDLKPLTVDQVVEVLRELQPQADAADEELRAIAGLAEGSPGRALELMGSEGARLFLRFRKLADARPPFPRRPLLDIAASLQRRDAAEDFPVFAGLLSDWIASTARRLALGNGRDAAHLWARAHQEIDHSIRRANALNLDRRQVLLEAFATIEEAARLTHRPVSVRGEPLSQTVLRDRR